MKYLNIAALIPMSKESKQRRPAKSKPKSCLAANGKQRSQVKRNKGKWVEKALVDSLQAQRGENDALKDLVREAKEPLEEKAPARKVPGSGEEPVPPAQRPNSEPVIGPPPQQVQVPVDNAPSVEFRVSELKAYKIPSWLPSVGSLLGAGCGAVLGRGASRGSQALSALAGGAIGLAVTYGLKMWASLKKERSIKVTEKVPKVSLSAMIASYNEGATVCPSSFVIQEAKLIGQFRTKVDESRPPHHQASKCQKSVPIQQWCVSAHGIKRTMLVNGDLFSELLAQNHSKVSEARTANIGLRTSNPADYNLAASVQAIVNEDTAALGRIFLGRDFH